MTKTQQVSADIQHMQEANIEWVRNTDINRAEIMLSLGMSDHPEYPTERELPALISKRFGKPVLSDDSIMHIMRKHGLIEGRLGEFTGAIPTLNLIEIKTYVEKHGLDPARLFIYAPREQFSTNPSFDDPIVAHYWRGYFNIVTHWGPESESFNK